MRLAIHDHTSAAAGVRRRIGMGRRANEMHALGSRPYGSIECRISLPIRRGRIDVTIEAWHIHCQTGNLVGTSWIDGARALHRYLDKLGGYAVHAQQIYERDRRHVAAGTINPRIGNPCSPFRAHIQRVGADSLRERLDQELRVGRGQNPERGRPLSTGIRKKRRGDQSIHVTRRPIGRGANAIERAQHESKGQRRRDANAASLVPCRNFTDLHRRPRYMRSRRVLHS